MGCQYYDPTDGGADNFSIAMPRLTFGRGCLDELGARALRCGLKSVVLLTDAGLATTDIVIRARQSLEQSNVACRVYTDIDIEPSDETVTRAAAFLADAEFDGVVSVGGGSVIDTAKAALVVNANGLPIIRHFASPAGEGAAITDPVKPHIACPTTSGTGSECTSVSVLRIKSLNTKFVIASPYMLPDVALVDPSCCDSLAGNVVASTGFDALCHALECFTARAYTEHKVIADVNARQFLQGVNPWSEMIAREALTLVSAYLERGVADAGDHKARDQLSWAATLAGMAFGNSGTHLPHAMSYGVTHLMRDVTTTGYTMSSPFIPHGISVAVSAPATFRYLAAATPERHLQAAAHIHADARGATPDEAGEVLATRIIELMRKTGIPNGLSAVGFGAGQVKALAESSIRQQRAINNAPRESNLIDLENIYSAALSYW